MSLDPYIRPRWLVPEHIKAFTTTRGLKGPSKNGYAQFNLALHVEDDPQTVLNNREKLRPLLQLPQEPVWLMQTHSTNVIELHARSAESEIPPHADASFTREPNVVCAILTADCLPILLYDADTQAVAAIHGGWRGLHAGIIQKTLEAMGANPSHVSAWLGPAISGQRYEVGTDLFDAFCSTNPNFSSAFTSFNDKWLLDINKIASFQLNSLGVPRVYKSNLCTFEQDELCFSYRRDGKKSGRMATLIWISQE